MHYTPYRDLLLKLFPNYLKVRKLPLNGGMSCPNLDGTKGFSGCSYCNNRSFSPVFDQAKVSSSAKNTRTRASSPTCSRTRTRMPRSST